MSQKIFGITGWKNSGKNHLNGTAGALSYRARPPHFNDQTCTSCADIDHEGTDSWRHRKAGAAEVAIVSSHRFAIMHENLDDGEPSLSQIVAKLGPAISFWSKVRSASRTRRSKYVAMVGMKGLTFQTDPGIVAVVSDMPQNDESLPVFDINAIDEIADFIEQEMAI